jgi:hypothetical protein
VVALVDLVEVDEVGYAFSVQLRGAWYSSREDADGGRTVAPLTSKKPSVFSQ